MFSVTELQVWASVPRVTDQWRGQTAGLMCAALKVSFFHEMIPVCSHLQSSCRILERLVFMAKSLNVYNECSQFLISFIKYFPNIYLEDNCD